MADFKIPDFLLNHSTNEIHKIMKDILPPDLDTSEGSHSWNLTRPTALVAAELYEFILPEIIKLIWPRFAYSTFLDWHAETRGMIRLNPTAANGFLTITGDPGSVIPVGSLFSTTSVFDEPSVDYEAVELTEPIAATGWVTVTAEPYTVISKGSRFYTADINGEPDVEFAATADIIIGESGTDDVPVQCLIPGAVGNVEPETVTVIDRFLDGVLSVKNEAAITGGMDPVDVEYIIPDTGIIKVPIRCTKTGIVGNTPKNTIIHTGRRIPGVRSVTNEEEITGGTELETDASLQERITEYDWTQGKSFVGNIADYKRWATSVDGVGAAVIIPANDDTGLVTIILLDANGAPATQELCEAVYNYIMRPDDEYQRLAPVNAYLSVIPPETLAVSVHATVELEHEATLESVIANFMAQLALYVPEAMEDNEIKYSRVWSILSGIKGVNDHKDLRIGLRNDDDSINYGTDNIPITSRQLPIIEAENLELVTGVVGSI